MRQRDDHVAELTKANETLKAQLSHLESVREAAAASCPICADTLEGFVVLKICGHAFCALCINKALKNSTPPTCPCCRAEVVTVGTDPSSRFGVVPPAFKASVNAARVVDENDQGDLDSRFIRALNAGDLDRVKELVGKGANLNAKVFTGEWCDSFPPIWLAIWKGYKAISLLFITAGAISEGTKTASDVGTLLSYACRESRGDSAVPLALLATGAFDSVLSFTGTLKKTAMVYAVEAKLVSASALRNGF